MRDNLTSNKLRLKPILGLVDENFRIGKYQRGYKWGKQETLDLLNDIHNHKVEDGIYYLQPLIIKSLETKNLEIVDGQQRLTTIYLLLNYLKHKKWIEPKIYNINFETRERSGEFLTKHLDLLYNSIGENINNDIDEKKLNRYDDWTLANKA